MFTVSLSLRRASLEESNNLLHLVVMLDSKLALEKCIRQMTSSISQMIGMLRNCYRTLGWSEPVIKSFFPWHISYLGLSIVFRNGQQQPLLTSACSDVLWIELSSLFLISHWTWLDGEMLDASLSFIRSSVILSIYFIHVCMNFLFLLDLQGIF